MSVLNDSGSQPSIQSCDSGGRLRFWRAPEIIIPFIAYVLHTMLFRDWIIDDAGISFVYARNLALGHGLVSQAGLKPVEGYSNPLWVALLALFFLLRAFHPLIAPKALSLICVGMGFMALGVALTKVAERRRVTILAALGLLALNSPFAIWTSSGLENPLFFCLASSLLLVTMRMSNRRLQPREAILAGALAAGLALTRPDGLLFFVLPPFLILLRMLAYERPVHVPQLAAAARTTIIYGLTFVALYGSYLLFRRLYFGEWAPNTYAMKGGPSWEQIYNVLTFSRLMRADLYLGMLGIATSGRAFALAIPILCAGVAMIGRRFRFEHFILLIFLATGAADYVLLPKDWMGEFRFGTLFIVFYYAFALAVADAALGGIRLPRRAATALLACAGALAIAASGRAFFERSTRFAGHPTVSFFAIADVYGKRYDTMARMLDLEEASVLLPDVGATLYYSRCRVFDLGGLCDPVIARTLGKDPEGFYHYVFNEARPTFIHVHDTWTAYANLYGDPRFTKQYVAVHEFPDIRFVGLSGDYVRLDALRNGDEDLRRLREFARTWTETRE